MPGYPVLDKNGNNLDPEAPNMNFGRRRSRAVLYQLAGQFQTDRKTSKIKLNNVSKTLHVLTWALN